MAKPKKSSPRKPISDVAHPGKSAPDNTSKSIIINRPMLQDPMMVANETAAETAGETTKPALKKEVITKPQLQVPSITSPTAKPAPEPTAEPIVEDKPEPDAPESAASDELPAADLKTESSVEEAEKAEEAARLERETKIQQTIDSKKYFLPIKTVEQRRSARFVALGIVLAIVLGLAWLDIALDAGLIRIHGLKPLTHLFTS